MCEYSVTVDIDPTHIHELTLDERGRVTLGSEFADEDAVVAVLARYGDDSDK